MGIIMYKNQYLCTTEDLAVEDSYEDQALDTLVRVTTSLICAASRF